MSKIAKAVQGFLKSMNWQWQEMEPNRYRVVIYGNTARWLWIAQWDEDDSFFAGYSYCPVNVPADRHQVAAEYLTRANWRLRLGNFELDYAEGEVCFKTSMVMENVRPTVELIRRTAFVNFQMVDRYLPGLMSVIYGKANPKAVIEEAERPKQEPAGENEEEEDDAAAKEATPVRRVLPKFRGARRKVRVDQFVRQLKLMDRRTHEEAKGSCFLTIAQPFDPSVHEQNPEAHDGPRVVQFCFEDKWFAIDIATTCLRPEDAAEILKQRRGFYREAENPDTGVTTSANDLVQFDPIGKKYIYGDEQEAAQDAVYVFYDVWGLSPQDELLVTASALDGPSWEKDAQLGQAKENA